MPNYRETSLTGTQWVRCKQIVINNPYNDIPTLELKEEQITALGESYIQSPYKSIFEDFVPTKEIIMLNPETDQPTGEVIQYEKVYEILYSLYIGLATARDNEPEPL